MVLDTVYMITMPKEQGIVYSGPALTAPEAWRKAELWLGQSKEALHKQGYRAKRVQISLYVKQEKGDAE